MAATHPRPEPTGRRPAAADRGGPSGFRRAWCYGSLVLVLLLAPRAGLPQPATSTAEYHLTRGFKFFQEKKFVEAAQEFRAAQALVPAQLNLFNEGRAWEEANRPEEAAAAFQEYLRAPENAEMQARAREKLTALEARLYGGVRVTCEPADARLTLTHLESGSIVRGRCPWHQDRLRRGAHLLEVEAEGHRTYSRRLTIDPGRVSTERCELIPVPGRLILSSSVAGAVVLVDGGSLGTTPRVEQELPPGAHEVEVRFGSGTPWRRTIEVAPGTRTVIEAEPTGGERLAWGWIAAGAVAGAVLLTGAILLPLALSEEHQRAELTGVTFVPAAGGAE